MLRWAIGFVILAVVAAALGFTGVAAAAANLSKVLFFVFILLFLFTVGGHLARRP